MSSAEEGRPSAPGPRLAPSGAAAMLVASAGYVVLYLIAALPSPLYPAYQQKFHFGGVVLTLVYAVYVLGNLVALLLLGRLPDQVGRKAVMLPATGIGAIGALLFVFADSVAWLFAARFVSGIATALAAIAATAWITELHPENDKIASASIASSANMLAFAGGALMTGLLAQFAAWPLRLAYVVYLGMLAVTGLVALRVPETVRETVTQWDRLSLRPRIGVPRQIRAAFFSPAITGFAIFALGGFYAALIPGLLRDSLHQKAAVVSGAVLFELFGIAAPVILLSYRMACRTSMLAGLAFLPPALGLLVAAQLLGSMPVLLIGTAAGGIAIALGYRGSLEVVNNIAPDGQRSEVLASYIVCCYVGIALPVIGVGVLAAFADRMIADVTFAIVIAMLAIAAFATGVKFGPR